jgi:uncharacterized protein YukE
VKIAHSFAFVLAGRAARGKNRWGGPFHRGTAEDAMAQAIVDPIELRRFAHHLKQFNADLRDRVAALHGQLIGLGDTWRDQEHEKFTQQFEEAMHVVNHFLEASDQHVPLLLRKAERIEEYLQQH